MDTQTVRRLRDALLEVGRPGEAVRPGPTVGREASLRRVEPFLETMYLVMMADGHVDDAEQSAIRGALRILTQDLIDTASLDTLLQVFAARLSEQGREFRLQAIGNRICANRRDRETAVTLAAAVALADDAVTGEEGDLVASLGEWFGVSRRRCLELLAQFDDGT
jgi:hypothetical protein